MKNIASKKLLPALFSLLFLLIFNSCIGLSMDIQMRRDGSGKISMEYRISSMAETIGKFDGNENWPIIPIGRADFERSIARIPGIRIASFSSGERQQDVITSVTLEFDNTQALLKFLDPSGTRSSFSEGRLDIILHESGFQDFDADLLDLVRKVSAGYNLTISFSADKDSTMTVTDSAGNEIKSPAGTFVQSGRKVSWSTGISEIFDLTNGLGVSFCW
jgi:hypothetical protein